jgi:hypothetical protein
MSEKEEEIKIVFAIWEKIAELQALLWERYYDEFGKIIVDLDTKRGIDTSNYPFSF